MRLALTTCVIRPWALSDAESLQRNANNRRVSINLRDRFPFPYELQHARTFLEWITRQPAPTVWAIEVQGDAAGAIGIERREDVERVSAEIGYWLGEPYWNRGVASEALIAVTAEVFRQFELFRLYAVPFADHAASIRVLQKAGYALEGRMRQSAIKDGKLRDQLMFAAYRTL